MNESVLTNNRHTLNELKNVLKIVTLTSAIPWWNSIERYIRHAETNRLFHRVGNFQLFLQTKTIQIKITG